MPKQISLVVVLLVFVAAVLSGCVIKYDSYEVGCDGFVIYGTEITTTIANYDSDGNGTADSEVVNLYIADGKGVLFNELIPAPAPVGGSASWGDIGLPWAALGVEPRYNPITVKIIAPSNGFLSHDVVVASFKGSCSTLPTWIGSGPASFHDGRINRYDAGAPVAIYPQSFGERGMGLRIYAIQPDSSGLLIMEVTPEELAAASGDWALVVSNTEYGVQVFKYMDVWQVNARADQGKTYVVTFEALSETAVVDSYTIDPQ